MIPYPPQLRECLNDSLAQIERRIEQCFAHSSSRLISWMRGLGGGDAAAYFIHPHAFPTFLLPWWLDLSLSRGHIEAQLHSALVYSSLNGYYCIRLIDDVMDSGQVDCRSLLPASAFFSSEFQSVYAQRFAPGDPFWQMFSRDWTACADATIASAALAAVDRTSFREICARKVAAARIPMLAVARVRGFADVPPDWERFFCALSEWHQTHNDWLDWQRDAAQGIPTLFLSEARRRKRPTDSLETWVIREGFRWGYTQLLDGLDGLTLLGRALGGSVSEYLEQRRAQLSTIEAAAAPGLAALGRLLESA